MAIESPNTQQPSASYNSELLSAPTSERMVDVEFLEREVMPKINKPGRYLGMEQGAYRKSFDAAKATMAMVFPDLYEIGISNYGIKLLYSVVNSHPDYMCDRGYAAAPDFREQLTKHNIPLYGVESLVPLKKFDLLAFTLQYELNYSTILGVLESAQLPLRAKDRDSMEYPILIAGGPGSGNPMPVAPFFDAFIIGDGEEVLIEILDVMAECRQKGWDKPTLLKALAKLDGVFIPGITERAYKRIVDIQQQEVDLAPLIPSVEAVHDRVTIEARRGCDRMCRFCQPCFINLPVREQTIDNIKESALKEIEKTGYEECSLLSLSIADYSELKPLVTEVAGALKEKRASISLPSQRADRFNLDVAESVQQIRKSTLTFAPEAGTPRLRDVINKNLTDTEILNAVTTSYRAGWNKVKLYFIIGLPTETWADLDGIVDIVDRLQKACKEIAREPGLSKQKHLDINVTLSNFVPKPHTPFQWFPQETMENLVHKITYLKEKFRGFRGVKLNFTDPEISKLEAVISKAGPEMADVLELAYKKGAYLDAWDDMLVFQRWFEAIDELGFDPESYTRERCVSTKDPLPWDCIDVGLEKEWLVAEYQKALEAASTTPCFENCSMCGVCPSYSVAPIFTPIEEVDAFAASVQLKPEQVNTVHSAAKAQNTAATALDTTSGAGAPVNPMKLAPVAKARLKLEKREKLRFISHLDWLRLLQRAVMRSNIPVAYSQGFNPKPRIHFGPALPLFMESMGEYVDVDLTQTEGWPEEKLRDALNPYLPEGGRISAIKILPMKTPSIDASIAQLEYTARWTCVDDEMSGTITERVEYLMAQPDLTIEVDTKKSKKMVDLRPYLTHWHVDEGTQTLGFTLQRQGSDHGPATGQPAFIKPDWLLKLINTNLTWTLTRQRVTLADSNHQPA